jgi:hypothetical protein
MKKKKEIILEKFKIKKDMDKVRWNILIISFMKVIGKTIKKKEKANLLIKKQVKSFLMEFGKIILQ